METQAVMGVLAAFLVPTVLGGVWLIRLEGRVNVQDALHRQLRADVSYIRERIDRAINGHGV